MSGIYCDHQEVGVESGSGDRIPGSIRGFNSHGNQTSSGQDQTNSSRSSQVGTTEVDFSSHARAVVRQNECHKLCPSTRAPVLSPPTDGIDEYTGAELPMLRSTSPSHTRVLGGAGVVGQQHVQVEQQVTNQREIDLVIDSDASLEGWGACCSMQRTGGPWSQQECLMHINCLELLAATLATKTFAKFRTAISISLRIDNTTAVAYVNNMGGTASKELVALTKDLWMWCLERNIQITAVHLPGVLNTIADTDSRQMLDRTDWKLNPMIFQSINNLYGPIDMDLFASKLSTQCPL